MNQQLLQSLFEDDRKEYATVWAYIFAYMVDGKFKSKRDIYNETGIYKMKLWRILKHGEAFGYQFYIKSKILYVNYEVKKTEVKAKEATVEKPIVSKEETKLFLNNKLDETAVAVPQPKTKYIEEIKQIIDYFNVKVKSKNPNAKGHQYGAAYINTHIIARLNEGYATTDFFIVIDNMYKEWIENKPEMSPYFRPQTLFGTKFGSYRDMIVVEHEQTESKSVKQLKELEAIIEKQDFSQIAKNPKPQNTNYYFITEELLEKNTSFIPQQRKFILAKKEKWICNYNNEDFKILCKKLITFSINLNFQIPDILVMESIAKYLDANYGMVTLKEIDIALGLYMAGTLNLREDNKYQVNKLSFKFLAEIITLYNNSEHVRKTLKVFNEMLPKLQKAHEDYLELKKKHNIDKKLTEYKTKGIVDNIEKTYDYFVEKHKLIDVTGELKKELFSKCIAENKNLDTKKDKDKFAVKLKEKILYHYFDSIIQSDNEEQFYISIGDQINNQPIQLAQ